MKKASNNLFQLIKSLSSSEKRYFNLYATTHSKGEKNNYLLLFDAIQQQAEYDEEALKEQFKDKRFVKYFPRAKNQLYFNILDSLHAYHTDAAPKEVVKKLLHQSEILFERNMVADAIKLLEKAKKIAKAHDLYLLTHRALELERKFKGSKHQKNKGAYLLKISEEKEKCVAIIENIVAYEKIYDQLYQLQKSDAILSRVERQQAVKELMDEPIVKSETAALCFKAKILYYDINGMYYFMSGNVQKAYELNKRYLKLFEASPDKLELYPVKYLNLFNNHLIDCYCLRRHTELNEGLAKLRSFNMDPIFANVPNIDIKVFIRANKLELNTCVNMGNFKEGLTLIKPIARGLEQFEERIPDHMVMSFYGLIALVYYGNAMYEATLDVLNKLKEKEQKGLLEDISVFARLLQAVVYFDLEKEDELETLIPSIKRYIKYRKRNTDFVNAFLVQLENIIYAASEKDRVNGLKNILQEVEAASKQEYLAFQNFKLIDWVNSKLQNKTYQELVQKRFKEKALSV